MHINIPTPAFMGELVMVSVGGTFRQTLSVVADSFWVATHIAVVPVRSVTGGAVGMAVHTLLLLLTGKVTGGTVVHALVLMKEEVLSTLWESEEDREKRRGGKRSFHPHLQMLRVTGLFKLLPQLTLMMNYSLHFQ